MCREGTPEKDKPRAPLYGYFELGTPQAVKFARFLKHIWASALSARDFCGFGWLGIKGSSGNRADSVAVVRKML